MKDQIQITGYVARDEDGAIHLFESDPERIAECAWAEFPGHTLGIRLPDNSFPSVTWESDPMKVNVSVSVLKPLVQKKQSLGFIIYFSMAWCLLVIVLILAVPVINAIKDFNLTELGFWSCLGALLVLIGFIIGGVLSLHKKRNGTT